MTWESQHRFVSKVKRLRRIYLFSIFGALGGLTGSYLSQWFLYPTLATPVTPGARFAFLLVQGLLVGGPIGFFPSFLERLGYYSFVGTLRFGCIGAVLGALGGMIALPCAEGLHVGLGGGVPGRGAALALLGLAVGIAEGCNGGARWWRGLLGGTIGGVAAGAVLEWLVTVRITRLESGLIALILIGFSIACVIAVFVNVLADAWLEGLRGSKVDGHMYHLGKFREPNEAVIGSDKKGAIFIWIPDAQPRHAAITLTASGSRLRHLAASGQTRVNGIPVKHHLLHNGDIIEIGSSRLKYSERRKTKLAAVDPLVASQPGEVSIVEA